MITLQCKDPAIERYYRRMFGRHLDQGIGVDKLRKMMRKEAARQEHYDYEVDPRTGRRIVLRGPNGPRLLIPDVVVSDP